MAVAVLEGNRLRVGWLGSIDTLVLGWRGLHRTCLQTPADPLPYVVSSYGQREGPWVPNLMEVTVSTGDLVMLQHQGMMGMARASDAQLAGFLKHETPAEHVVRGCRDVVGQHNELLRGKKRLIGDPFFALAAFRV